ncbi:MAG TPA: macro domain-containing protein [Candidatus Manganitrophaceae bacterium]|nr:macro domain-containing protein [Candidatus Manganitrophaceae bacterium]
MKIEIVQGSILDIDADAIVNPANSGGWMGGGVAGAIRRAAGAEVEAEAMAAAPIPVGAACLTKGGATRFRGIIHAPTMTRPAEAIPVENVRKATRAALQLAEEARLANVALPGMGTGVGRVSPKAAAEAMIGEIVAFERGSIRKILLVDVAPEMVAAWKEVLSKQNRQ